MRIRTQLRLTMALVFGVVLLVAGLAWQSVNAANKAGIEQERSRTVARHATALLLLTQEYPRYFEERVAQQWRERHSALVVELTQAALSGPEWVGLDALRDSARRLPMLFDRLTSLTTGPEVSITARRADFLVDQMINETQGLADGVYRWSREAAAAQQTAMQRYEWISVLSLALLVVLLLGQSIVIARRMVGPVTRIERAVAAVEAGNLGVKVGFESADELGHLARGFDSMTSSLAERRDELRAEMLRREASEQRLTAITNNIPALIGYYDAEQRLKFANGPALQRFGLEAEKLGEYSMRTALGEALYAQHELFVPRVLVGQRVTLEAQWLRDGSREHYQSHLVPDVDTDGRVQGFYAMTFDVTALKQAEEARAAGELRLRTITDHLPALISYVDEHHFIRFCNGTYRSWLGVEPTALIDKHLRDAVGPALYAQRSAQLERALGGERVEFETMSIVRGASRYLRTEYIPDVRADGHVVGVYALSADITALKEAEARMSEQARSDSLTGLPNRRQLNERLEEALARSRRSQRPLALMFLDIDHFKSINDTLGHKGGDIVLQEFARRLVGSVRGTDTVARLAGDEFVVVLEGLNIGPEAEQVARKILRSMTRPFEVGGTTLSVTTSIGVVVSGAGPEEAADLLTRADEALYRAKRSGRNTFAVSMY